MNIEERLDALFREACDMADGEEVRDEWDPSVKAGWDSLADLTLIGLIEKEFSVTLEFDEILAIPNWGEFKKLVAEKAAGAAQGQGNS
jgi:acyl carrier protein